jgi:hypothetical protein
MTPSFLITSHTIVFRETSEIQKRGQVGVVHDDDDDGAVPEEHDRTVQMHSEDQQEVLLLLLWE